MTIPIVDRRAQRMIGGRSGSVRENGLSAICSKAHVSQQCESVRGDERVSRCPPIPRTPPTPKPPSGYALACLVNQEYPGIAPERGIQPVDGARYTDIVPVWDLAYVGRDALLARHRREGCARDTPRTRRALGQCLTLDKRASRYAA